MFNEKITYIEKKINDLIKFSSTFNSLPDSSLRTVFNQDSQAKIQKLLKLGATADDQIISKYISLDDLTKTKLNFLNEQTKILSNSIPLSTSDLFNVRKIKLAYYFYNALSPYRKKRRLTISPVNAGDFTAIQMYVNPDSVEITRDKRCVKQDTLNGVIMQDFGYRPRVITIHGTTGADFYEGIEKLNQVWLNKKSRLVKVIFGGLETDIINNKGDFEFKAFWENFKCSVSSENNLFNYTLVFIELREKEPSSTISITSAIESVITNFNLAKQIDKKTSTNTNQLVATSLYVPKIQEDMYMYYAYKTGADAMKNVSNEVYSFDKSSEVVSNSTADLRRLRDNYSLPYTNAQLDESMGYVSSCMEILYRNLSPYEFNSLDLTTMYNDVYSEHLTRVNQYENYFTYLPIKTINTATSLVYQKLNTSLDRTTYGITINENFKFYNDVISRFFKIYYSTILPKNSLDDVVLLDIENAYDKINQQMLYAGTDTGPYSADESIILSVRAAYIKKIIVNLLFELDTLIKYENDDIDQYVVRNFKKLMELLRAGATINDANGTEQFNLRYRLRRDIALRNNIDEFVFIVLWYYTIESYNNNSTITGSYLY